jgi:hypothetical protein
LGFANPPRPTSRRCHVDHRLDRGRHAASSSTCGEDELERLPLATIGADHVAYLGDNDAAVVAQHGPGCQCGQGNPARFDDRQHIANQALASFMRQHAQQSPVRGASDRCDRCANTPHLDECEH